MHDKDRSYLNDHGKPFLIHSDNGVVIGLGEAIGETSGDGTIGLGEGELSGEGNKLKK